MRALSFSLRWLGLTVCAGATSFIASLAVNFHYLHLFMTLPREETKALWERMATSGTVFGWVGVTTIAFFCAGSWLLLRAAPSGRANGLAATTLAVGLVTLVIALFDLVGPELPVVELGKPVPSSVMVRRVLRLIWAIGDAAVLPLALGVAWAALPAFRRVMLPVLIALAALGVIHVTSRGVLLFGSERSDFLIWASRAVRVASLATFAVGALLMAGGAVRVHESATPATSGMGTALRLLGYALLLRVALGVAGQCTALAFGASGMFSAARAATTFTMMLGMASAALVAIGLVAYLRLPENYRAGTAIVSALIALTFGAVLDAWSGMMGIDLLSMSERATATASEVQAAMAALRWSGRLALGLGLIALLAVLTSFSTTALALGNTALGKHASSVVRLTIFLGIAAVAASFALGEPSLAVVGLLIGIIVFCLAVVILTRTLRLCFELAHALDAAAE